MNVLYQICILKLGVLVQTIIAELLSFSMRNFIFLNLCITNMHKFQSNQLTRILLHVEISKISKILQE